MGPFRPPVSASKISVPGSGVRDRFDDWVGSWQFGPFRLVHLNARNLLQDELTVSNIRDAEATASTPEPEGGARCVSSEWDSPFDLNLIKPPPDSK
jgi:hypothetical protein